MAVSGSKARTFWPLPGGSGEQLSTLLRLLQQVHQTTDAFAVESWMVAEFGLTSTSMARKYLLVPQTLGLISLRGPFVKIELTGRDYLFGQRREIIRDALMDRVAGCTEIVAALHDCPLRIGEILSIMQSGGFDSWTTPSQVRHRLRWLEEAQVLERLGRGRDYYQLCGVKSG